MEAGRPAPAKRLCLPSPPDDNDLSAESGHEVSLSYDATGIVDASSFVGSPREVAASSCIKPTQGVVVNSGLPREVAPKSSCALAGAPDCLIESGSSQYPLAHAGATPVVPLCDESASCERPTHLSANVPTLGFVPSLDDVSDPVSPQGGAVDVVSPKPLCHHPAPSQAAEPDDLARNLLASRNFSATAALKLVDLLPRDSGLRRVQGNGGSRLAFGAYWGIGKVSMFKNTLRFPCSCKYLCAFVHHIAPQHEFSAF